VATFPHNPKEFDKNRTIKPENGFRVKKWLFGNLFSISVLYVTHIKRNIRLTASLWGLKVKYMPCSSYGSP
jgi:hypothetical protein